MLGSCPTRPLHVPCSYSAPPPASRSKPPCSLAGIQDPCKEHISPCTDAPVVSGLQGSCICNMTHGYSLPNTEICIPGRGHLRCLLPVQVGTLPEETRTQDDTERNWSTPASHPLKLQHSWSAHPCLKSPGSCLLGTVA